MVVPTLGTDGFLEVHGEPTVPVPVARLHDVFGEAVMKLTEVGRRR